MSFQGWRDEENGLEPFFSLSPGLLCIAGFDGYFKRLNPAWEKNFGYSTEELLARPFLEFVHPDDRGATAEETQKLAGGAETIFFQNRYRCRDGSYKWLRWQATPFVERQQIYAIAVDITELRLAQEAMPEAYAQTLNSVISASPAPIVALDSDRIVRMWNQAAERTFGWTAAEVIGSSLPFIPEERKEEGRELGRRALTGESLLNVEVQRRRKDGVLLDLLLSSAPISDGAAIRGFVAVYADITERKDLERRFLRAQRMESLGTLASGISHDLNNIFAPILMAVELLRIKHADESDQRILGTLRASARRGGELVKQVLTFARGLQGERVTMQPRHIVLEVEKMARETFPRNIAIQTDISKNLWTITADATQLHQILMNLCINARDAMPSGGTLAIAARNASLDQSYASMSAEGKAGSYVVLQVSDTGDGIPADIIDKIFDPYFTTKEPGKGTGLGLSTVLAIVKAHGGFVNVQSEPGKGTQFAVYLPAAMSAEAPQTINKLDTPLGNGELILVVDDEAAVRDIARATLEAHNYRAITAAHGAEAMALYVQHRNEIAAVLSDNAMPVMDGAALARALESIDAHVKIISMSGLREPGRNSQGPSLPRAVRSVLPKPFTAEQLMRTLDDLLKGA